MKTKYLYLTAALFSSVLAREGLESFLQIHRHEPEGMDMLPSGFENSVMAAILHAAVSGVDFILWLLVLSFGFLLLISLAGRFARHGLTL